MSLLVWLPLNGNLENQGASNLQFTQSGTAITIDNNGKIGQCYTRATVKSAGRIQSDNTILLNGDLSMCCWAKVTATVGDTANGLISNHSASSNAGFGITVKQISTDDYRISCSTGNGSGRTYMTYYGTTNIKNAWHHLALTYNSTTHVFQLWVDGIVEKTQDYTNSAIAGKIFLFDWNLNGTNNNYKPACSLNDVRIYNHCLSPAEVHEISQGLVLHYKLDDNIQTITNAFNMGSWNTNTVAGGFSTWGSSGHKGSRGANTDRNYIYNADRTYSYWIANGADSTPLTYLFYQSPAFEGGYRSLSAILKEENGNLITEDIIRPAWNANVVGEGHAPAATWTRVIPLRNEFYLCQVDGLYQDGSNDLAGLNVTRGHKVYISEIWLENDKQVASNPIFPSTMIQDNSGYGHNGTITGNVLLNSNTPRYSASSLFNGTERITTTTPGADIRTLSCWCKTTKNKSTSQQMVADSFSNMTISFYQGTVIGVFGTTRGTGSKCTLGNSYKENDWNHIVVVKTDDAGARDIYCNGVKLTPASNDYWSAATGFFVGARNTSNGNPFYGQISDVRAYCTALSAADVKQLYELGAKVDNKQNLHIYEAVEMQPTIKLTKQGQIKAGEFQEDTTTKLYETNQIVETNNLIEF